MGGTVKAWRIWARETAGSRVTGRLGVPFIKEKERRKEEQG